MAVIIKLSNFVVFMLKNRNGHRLLPLRVRRILWCYLRVAPWSPVREKRETLRTRRMLYNRVDQLRNADGLCKKWMPLDIETTLCLGSGHKRRKKYDWRVVQSRVGL